MSMRKLPWVAAMAFCTGCTSWGHLAERDYRQERPSVVTVEWHKAARPGLCANELVQPHEIAPIQADHRFDQEHGASHSCSSGEGSSTLASSVASNVQVIHATTDPRPQRAEVFATLGERSQKEGSAVVPPRAVPNEDRDLDPVCIIAFVFAVLGIVLFLLNNQVSLMLSLFGFLFGILGLISAGSGDRKGRGFAIAAMALLFVLVILRGLASENGTR